jgi:hypothetical protein
MAGGAHRDPFGKNLGMRPDSEEFDARPVRAFLPRADLRVDESLSFIASLGLAALLHDLAAAGSQLVVGTHSPVVAAIPGAHLLELGPWGIRPAAWEDVGLVIGWRQFMRDPRSYFRHLLDDRTDGGAP